MELIRSRHAKRFGQEMAIISLLIQDQNSASYRSLQQVAENQCMRACFLDTFACQQTFNRLFVWAEPEPDENFLNPEIGDEDTRIRFEEIKRFDILFVKD